MNHTLKSWYVTICLLIVACGFVFSLYQQLWPIKVITIHSPLAVVNKRVKAGEVLIYTGDYCLYKTYPATISRTILDGTSIQLPIVNGVGELGCHKTNVQVPIPDGAIPGVYHLWGIASYRITATRNIDVPFYTEDFTIVK